VCDAMLLPDHALIMHFVLEVLVCFPKKGLARLDSCELSSLGFCP